MRREGNLSQNCPWGRCILPSSRRKIGLEESAIASMGARSERNGGNASDHKMAAGSPPIECSLGRTGTSDHSLGRELFPSKCAKCAEPSCRWRHSADTCRHLHLDLYGIHLWQGDYSHGCWQPVHSWGRGRYSDPRRGLALSDGQPHVINKCVNRSVPSPERNHL